MIDILYIKGVKSPNEDNELLYSLRSLSKNVKDSGRVFVTGKCPSFVKNIIHTPVDDIGCKMINHWWKVTQTILQTDISDNFVLMYDDIFFLKEIELSKYPFYNMGQLGEHITGTPQYRKNLEEARRWLYNNGYGRIDFELHVPIIYNREKFLKLREIYEPYIDKPVAPAPRSIYGNIYNLPTEYREDLKIRNKSDTLTIGDVDCFSTSDEAFKHVLPLLKEKFPERCEYENSIRS